MGKFVTYNLEILTVIMFSAITFIAALVPHASMVQRIMVVYMLLYTLHEWEENRYPGGFSNIMEGIIGKTFSEEAKELSHIPVFVLLVAILFLPCIFDSVIVLALIPVFLGLFEGFVHTMGVKLSNAEKFYTPGMVTAYCLFGFSAFVICYFVIHKMATAAEFGLGFLCMVLSFAIMQNRVLAINGVKYRDMIYVMRSKVLKK